jgi:hypothetical protein
LAALACRSLFSSLFLVFPGAQTKNTLLQFCNFVQWVPDSDVVVAQVCDVCGRIAAVLA